MSKNAHNVVGKCDSMHLNPRSVSNCRHRSANNNIQHCTDHQARCKLLSHLFIFCTLGGHTWSLLGIAVTLICGRDWILLSFLSHSGSYPSRLDIMPSVHFEVRIKRHRHLHSRNTQGEQWNRKESINIKSSSIIIFSQIIHESFFCCFFCWPFSPSPHTG